MALFKYKKYVGESGHYVFDEIYNAGDKAPLTGIYRCEGCGDEVASNKGNPLPPQNHHQHAVGQGTIRWRLTVYSVTKD